MISSLQSEREAAPAAAGQGYATCPLCHTIEMSLSDDALAAGGDWQCRTCGQQWDAPRLATAAAYAVWAVQREVVANGKG